MKILYCIAGHGIYGVLESEIVSRGYGELSRTLIISAKRVFSLEVNPSQVVTPGGQSITFAISTYNNVMINCSFIADMSEQAPFYQEIIKILRKETISEN